MAADTTTPLASVQDLAQGGFGDLVRSFPEPKLADFMIEATRACETECDRRLAPFEDLVESHRAEGIDPDEYSSTGFMPLDLVGALGRSKALAYGSTDNLVRHVWLNECAPHYAEMWSYSNVSIEVVLSYGGKLTIAGDSIVGPEHDSGHVWFNAGVFVPVGSLIRPKYSGGYTTVPRDLSRACQYMAAAIAARELDPLQQPGHDPTQLEAAAVAWLVPYART